MIIIPAIDIYQNKVVRLAMGDFDNVTFYKNSPLAQAMLYAQAGFKLIHVVDLEGSRLGKFTTLEIIGEIKALTELKIQFGGGIRDMKTAAEAFSAGVDFAIIGSLAVKNKDEFELVAEKFSADKIVAAVDAMDEMLAVSGWTEDTEITIYEQIEYCKGLGVNKFLCTDISKDGMLSGTNIDLYKKILKKFPGINLIASGGIKDLDDIKLLKSEVDPYAVVVGKAIYEDKVDLEELIAIAE